MQQPASLIGVGGLRGTGSHDVAVHDVFVPIAYASGFYPGLADPEAENLPDPEGPKHLRTMGTLFPD